MDIASLVASPPAYSQLLSFGVKAGTPLTTPYTTQFIPDGGASTGEQRFTVAPTIEVHLPLHLSVEADALWRQSSFSEASAHINPLHATVNDWQIPSLGKYEEKVGPLHPFIDGGVVYRHVDQFRSAAHKSQFGWCGVRRRRKAKGLAYSVFSGRWPTPAFSAAGPVISKSNQVDLFVGVTF